MTIVRLVADDLTGALDTAVQFTPLTGPYPVYWRAPTSWPGSCAFDAETRDIDIVGAIKRARAAPKFLAEADLAFKKVDSLLRGHIAAEVAAMLENGTFTRAIVAPAYPAQGRVTRGGTQFRRRSEGDGWERLPADLLRDLAGYGVNCAFAPSAAHMDADATVVLCDAETDEDLREIAVAGRALGGRTLWCGSAGLARALAPAAPVTAPQLERPILGLIGSDHPVTRAQLAAAGSRVVQLRPDTLADWRCGADMLRAEGQAILSFQFPEGTDRRQASAELRSALSSVLGSLPHPRTLFAAGGDTLLAVCEAAGIGHLVVEGELEPGIPSSRALCALWGDIRVYSKSGAFGKPDMLARLFGRYDRI